MGRDWLFAEVRAWATTTDPSTPQVLLIGADYGLGKSACLAELIVRAGEGDRGHPHALGDGGFLR